MLWLRALATLLPWLTASISGEGEVTTTCDPPKEPPMRQAQQDLVVSRTRLIMSKTEQRLASRLETRLAAMEARSTQELQAGVLALSNKVDIAVSVLQDLFKSKLAALDVKLTEGHFSGTLRCGHSSTLMDKVASLEKQVTDLTAKQAGQSTLEDDVERTVQRLNQTIMDLKEGLVSKEALQTARLQNIEESLRKLRTLMEVQEIATTTQIPKCTYPPNPSASRYGTAMFAAAKTNFSRRHLLLEEVYDVNDDYSSSAGMFSPSGPPGGVYFHSISAANLPEIGIGLQLKRGSSWLAGLLIGARNPGIETVSRQLISGESPLYASLAYGHKLFSNKMMQTSWVAVGISNSMKRAIAFTVERNSEQRGSVNPLPFQVTVTSVGGGINSRRDSFTAPQAGVYLLSISLQPCFSGQFQASLMRGPFEIFRFGRQYTKKNRTCNTVSRIIVIQLAAGDKIGIKIYGSNARIYSNGKFDHDYITSFSGFLYDPLHEAPIAWSVAKNTSVNSVPRGQHVLSYEKVILNQGNAWNSNASAIVAPLAGYYFVHISAGAVPRKPVHVYVTINGQPFVDLMRSVGWHTGVDHISRSALLRLKAGDTVQITADRGTGVYSDSGLQTSFCGFLAYRES